MLIKRIAFVDYNNAQLVEEELDDSVLLDHEVLVKNLVSTISSGTERANLIGERVGEAPVVFPRYSGYSNCVEVIKVGKAVTSLKPGDRAISIWGSHSSFYRINEENLVLVPKEVSSGHAAMMFIATFPIAAIRKVRLELGENCAVIGLGLLGQFAIQFAKAAGAYPVIGVDPNKTRREEALNNGADFVFDPTDPNYKTNVLKVAKDGYITAIEVTGNGHALNQTLELMKKFGRVALLGCTRNNDFTVDYYARIHLPGVELIGAHALARPEKESSPHNFTNRDDLLSIINLYLGNRINIKKMPVEMHSPTECHEVYKRLVEDKDFPTVVQFDWCKL